jgi:hypothetical protein
VPAQRIKAAFTEPMLLLPARTLPEGVNWAYELKLDGYRVLAIKSGGKVHLRSRNNKDFNPDIPPSPEPRLGKSHRFLISSALGNDHSDIVVLFTGAKLFKSIDNSRYHHLWR